jgi:serine/threonine-protein kinase
VALRGADGKVRLHTRVLHDAKLTALAGTENGDSPFFSPDGQWIGFYADTRFKRISVHGGAAVTICEAGASRGASWGEDGNIVLGPSQSAALSRVSAEGGVPSPLTKLSAGERTHRWPQVLPGSRAVLFTAHSGANNYDGASIDVFVVKTGERKTVQRGGFSGRYMALPDGSGRLLYLHQGTLFAAPFDLGKLAVTGTPIPVVEEVSSSGNGGADYAISATGTMVYLAGKGQAGTWTISWVDSAGTKPLYGVPGAYFTPRFSPDGKRLAFAIGHVGGTGGDLWVKDLDRDASSRLSFLGGANNWPVWMPDGKGIIFKSADAVNPGLYWVRSDGAGEAQRLTDGSQDEYPDSISPDGKRLSWSQRGTGSTDVFTAPIEGDPAHLKLGKPELFLGTPFVEAYSRFSPDGRWMAYASNESGTFEIYVRPFPGPGGRWQVSTGGGNFPIWAANGRELLYRNSDQRIMAVNYTAKGDSFAADKPRVWSETRVMPLGTFVTWDLAPDSKRMAAFLYGTEAQQKLPTHLTFLVNFADELQRHGGVK